MGLYFPELFLLECSTSFSGWQLHVAGGLEVPTQAIVWFHDSIILLFVFDIGQEGLYWHFLKSMLVAVLKGLTHLFVFFFVVTDFSSCFAWVHLFSFVCILPSVKKKINVLPASWVIRASLSIKSCQKLKSTYMLWPYCKLKEGQEAVIVSCILLDFLASLQWFHLLSLRQIFYKFRFGVRFWSFYS